MMTVHWRVRRRFSIDLILKFIQANKNKKLNDQLRNNRREINVNLLLSNNQQQNGNTVSTNFKPSLPYKYTMTITTKTFGQNVAVIFNSLLF